MITFLTLFLNLTAGVLPVAVSVADPVARVELVLDGERVGALDGPPWVWACNFGAELRPHELEAVAYDARGRELDRVMQRINLPRGRAEASLVLGPLEDGVHRFAQLRWTTVESPPLEEVRVLFDGRRLKVPDSSQVFPLPEHDPGQLHHLSAELTFENGDSAHTAVAFGGRYGDRVESALTPILVHADGPLPTRDELAGAFSYRGRPVPVFTVERPAAEIRVVRDVRVIRALRTMSWLIRRSYASHGLGRVKLLGWARLSEGTEARFLATAPEPAQPGAPELFSLSEPVTSGLGQALAEMRSRIPKDRPQRLADAVAVAGLGVAGVGAPRAVVLVLDPLSPDASAFTPQGVRRYLAALQVPLEVWSPVPETAEVDSPWGLIEDVSGVEELEAAVGRLRDEMERQAVIWLQGRLLPQTVELSAEWRDRLELVRD